MNRFAAPPPSATAATRPIAGMDAELARVAEELRAESDPAKHGAIYAKAQERIDAAQVVVPLFVAERVGLVRSEVGEVAMGVNLYAIGLEGVLNKK